MKFKVEPKDFFLFVLYCILLLYLCALAVSNMFCLLNEGRFYGLIPLSAFTPKYLPFTILLFGGALALIFKSVSSYIFSKDKSGGLGIKLKEKESDGYSSWAKEKDIKNDRGVVKVIPTEKQLDAAGIPLINNGKEIWVDNGDYHNLVIGSTGSGKSESLVFPMVNLLAKKGESMIITDPKGEIYRKTAKNLESRGYKIITLNFRDPLRGNSWNPLAMPYQFYKNGNVDKSIELLDDVAQSIFRDAESKDPFWQNGASDYFSGLALGLFQDAKESEINFNSINYMSTIGEERYAPNSNYIKEYFNMKGADSTAYTFASTTITSPSETKGGLLSTFREKIRIFSTRESLSEMLSHSDFNMRDIGKGKTAVFMIIHDEKTTYHSLMTIFIKQCYETLIDVAQENGGKLEYRTNFILDEFANMPPLKDVDSMVSAARSRDIRFTFIIQNFAQLNDVYGEQVAQVIRGNCGNLIYLISTELAALKEISEMCGEVKSKDKDKTETRPLVTVTDLQKLKMGEAIIIRLRKNPFKTKYVPNFKMDWGETYPEADYPTRKPQKIELFDLKKFVSEERSKKMANNPSQMPSGFRRSDMMMNPFAMGQSNPMMDRPVSNNINPFAQSASENIGPNPFSQRNSGNIGDNPFAPNNSSNAHQNPFMSNIRDIDIDAMIKDIDKKLQELDEEEKRQKDKLKAQNQELMRPKTIEKENKADDLSALIEKIDNAPKEKAEEIKNDDLIKKVEKPKINIDVDSVIVNENVITDDEFFDDFFGDDDDE